MAINERPKITIHHIEGVRLSCFKDPSVIGGEWVINSPNIHKRMNAARWKRKDALSVVAGLENQYLDMKSGRLEKDIAERKRLFGK